MTERITFKPVAITALKLKQLQQEIAPFLRSFRNYVGNKNT